MGKDGGVSRIEGASSTHTYSAAEKRAYCDFINKELAEDSDLSSYLPMDPLGDDLFTAISKGVMLCKLINNTFENEVPLNKLNKNPKNMYQVNENHDLCISAAIHIGCSVVNIGGKDLAAGVPHLTMGLLWQIIKRSLMYKIENMDMARFLAAEESLADIAPEQIILRWFNAHLRNAGHNRTVANFSQDIQDGENYAVLLSSIAPDKISSADLEKVVSETDLLKRAEMILEWADRLDCRQFVTAQDIVDGNPNLNLAFTACLFQKYPDIGPSNDQRVKELESKLNDIEAQLGDSLREKESLEDKFNRARMDFDALSSEFNDVKLKLDDKRAEKDSLNKDKATLEELLDEGRKKKTSLTEQCDAKRKERDDLRNKLAAERAAREELEASLSSLRDQQNAFNEESNKQIDDLNSQISNTTKEKDELASKLEATMSDLQKAKDESAQRVAELNAQIEDEIAKKKALDDQLAGLRTQIEEANHRISEAERTKEELFKLLQDTIAELETTRANSEALNEQLRSEIAAEIAEREQYEAELAEKIREFELAMEDWAAERARLLARIKELEDEIEATKAEMRRKLDEAEKAKEDALALSAEEMRRLLTDAENEKNQALDKVRMLLQGTQKQGYLWRQENTLVGLQWKKKFFVLRDNLLSWYSSEKKIVNQKPKGVIYCEEARLYEMDASEIRREHCFQIDNGSVRHNIAADSVEEMKEWMTEIRVAKKKKLGVKVVGEDRTGNSSPRNVKSPR